MRRIWQSALAFAMLTALYGAWAWEPSPGGISLMGTIILGVLIGGVVGAMMGVILFGIEKVSGK